MKNSLGVEITRPNNILIVMRGIPGSGKSTLAKRLVNNGVIHSTDDVIEANHDYFQFFADMAKNNDFSPLGKVHAENTKNAKQSMLNNISPVIIDNTNIKANEPKDLIEFALKNGYADENIEFVEVGTGGLLAEELAKRNTHGVPLEKIKAMIDSMKSIGPLTVEKVVDAKPMFKNNKLFASVVLDDSSRSKLVTALMHRIPKDWKLIAHHMTINYGKGLGKDRAEDNGKKVNLVANEIGISDMAIAVKVDGYPSDNKIPHVTLAINPNGGKAVMSNDITNWTKLDSYINLSGIVTEEKLK